MTCKMVLTGTSPSPTTSGPPPSLLFTLAMMIKPLPTSLTPPPGLIALAANPASLSLLPSKVLRWTAMNLKSRSSTSYLRTVSAVKCGRNSKSTSTLPLPPPTPSTGPMLNSRLSLLLAIHSQVMATWTLSPFLPNPLASKLESPMVKLATPPPML